MKKLWMVFAMAVAAAGMFGSAGCQKQEKASPEAAAEKAPALPDDSHLDAVKPDEAKPATTNLGDATPVAGKVQEHPEHPASQIPKDHPAH